MKISPEDVQAVIIWLSIKKSFFFFFNKLEVRQVAVSVSSGRHAFSSKCSCMPVASICVYPKHMVWG